MNHTLTFLTLLIHYVMTLCDECFPVAKIKLKQKNSSPLGLQEVLKRPPKESRNYTNNFLNTELF